MHYTRSFDDHVDRTGDCWLWTRARTGANYGAFYEATVRVIRMQLAAGASGADMARAHGVTNAMISRIRLNRAWKHLAEIT